jgi:hypothetical protein
MPGTPEWLIILIILAPFVIVLLGLALVRRAGKR